MANQQRSRTTDFYDGRLWNIVLFLGLHR
jgi:hypothetical protein